MITETPERTFQASCDIDGTILDPGAADAPMGGYPTREAAQKAAEAHDWFTDEGGDVHFCKPCTDLYLALSIIDDARHAICGPGRKVAHTEAVLFGEDATRLVRLLGQMKHDAAVGQIPVRLAIHQHHDQGGRS